MFILCNFLGSLVAFGGQFFAQIGGVDKLNRSDSHSTYVSSFALFTVDARKQMNSNNNNQEENTKNEVGVCY